MVKYDINSVEGEYQPHSNESVLLNRLAITEVEEINEVETLLLLKLYEHLFAGGDQLNESIKFASIAEWHRQWLGNVYPWAGELRSVNMGKGGFEFASALQIAHLLEAFDKNYLSQSDSLATMALESLVEYLAEVHVEFILIHPFREGNGRLSRLLLDVLAYKAGYQPLDYSLWDEHKTFYFKSIQAGVAGNFEHIKRLVRDVLSA